MRFGRLSATIPAAAFTAVVAFVLYLPSLGGAFLNFDDWLYYEDPHITAFSLTGAFTDVVASNWHPLTVISYAVDYKLRGLNPGWFHLVNNIFHSLNVALVFLLASRLFGPSRGFDRKTAASLFVALLFAVHPLHVESVSWIAERKDVLCGFFFLSSLLAYLYFAEGSPGDRYLRYCSVLILFALALLSKPMAISLPAVLLIADYYPLGRLKSFGDLKRVLPEKVPFFILSVISGLLTIWAQKAGGAVAPVELYPLGWRLWYSARALVFYLYKTLVPVGLSPYYPIDVNTDYFGLGGASSIAIIAAITLFAVIMAVRTRAFWAVWAYFLVTLGPVLGIVQAGGQAAADRYMYLPSLGLFLLAGAGVLAAGGAKKRFSALIFACAIAVVVALSALTVRQQAFWADSVSLWSREIETFPGFYLGYNYRGSAWAEAAKFKEAVADYSVSIRLKPSYPEAYVNRGIARWRLEEYEDAKQDLLQAIRLNPGLAPAYHYLALTFMSMGEQDLANEVEKKARALGYR